MELQEAINTRRAYRSLEKVEITDEMVSELANAARLAPSCYNNQPWRYVFVYEDEMLEKMHEALAGGNDWAKKASMIIAVFSRKDLDCVIKDRVYDLFDTGMATGFLILKATEMGLVAHPIAGFSPQKAKEILDIPEEMDVITLVIVGKHTDEINDLLTDRQAKAEPERPEREPLDELVYLNKYGNPFQDE